MGVRTETRSIPADAEAPETAARILADGGLVAFPTETVYGLGADATNGAAVARLYQAKGRPSFNPLIVHIADFDAAQQIAKFDAQAKLLARAFWPGPLTLVLPRAAHCPVTELATAGLETVAVRVSSHPIAQEILAAFGKPVVAPSANRSGHVSSTTARHVETDLAGKIDLIVDGGSATVGIESTIVGCFDRPLLLRPGGLARANIEAALGRKLEILPQHGSDGHPLAPGMLASHYAPRTAIRLDATAVEAGEALLAFGPKDIAGADKAVAFLNLSERGDLVEGAANLFSYLRKLDTTDAKAIAVMPIPSDGLGEAINDRLRRAAV